MCLQSVFSSLLSKKLPIVVVRDVCSSVRSSFRLSVRPSVSMSFRGNLISNEPIDPKIGMNAGYGVVHV